MCPASSIDIFAKGTIDVCTCTVHTFMYTYCVFAIWTKGIEKLGYNDMYMYVVC